MRKLTVKEFFESKEKLCVKVSKEEYDTYARAFDDDGYTWNDRDKYTEWNPFLHALFDKPTEYTYLRNDGYETREKDFIAGHEQVLLKLEQVQTVAEYIDSLNSEAALCIMCYELKNSDDCTGNRCIECEFNRSKTSNLIAIGKMLQEPITNYIKPQPFEKGQIIEVSDDEKYWHLQYFVELKYGRYECVCSNGFHSKWNHARLPKGVE